MDMYDSSDNTIHYYPAIIYLNCALDIYDI